MNAERRAYLDTSALAKWYLNEPGSEDFVRYIQGLDVAVISSLTQTEMRLLLARRRRTGELTHELESVVYASFLDDITQGSLQLYSCGGRPLCGGRQSDLAVPGASVANAGCPASRGGAALGSRDLGNRGCGDGRSGRLHGIRRAAIPGTGLTWVLDTTRHRK